MRQYTNATYYVHRMRQAQGHAAAQRPAPRARLGAATWATSVPQPPACGAAGPPGMTCTEPPLHTGHHLHVGPSLITGWPDLELPATSQIPQRRADDEQIWAAP